MSSKHALKEKKTENQNGSGVEDVRYTRTLIGRINHVLPSRWNGGGGVKLGMETFCKE